MEEHSELSTQDCFEPPAPAPARPATVSRFMAACLVPAVVADLFEGVRLAAADQERIGMRIFVAVIADGMTGDAVIAAPAEVFCGRGPRIR